MSLAIGVDPGLSGAIAVVSSQRGFLEVASLPTQSNGAGPDALVQRKVDADRLLGLIAGWSTRHEFAREHVTVVIERMQPFKASPAVLLSMGYSAGIAEGVLRRYADQFLCPLPKQWKKQFGLGAVKRQSIEEMRRRLPVLRKVSHDQAEAVLLALWGLGQVTGAVADQLEDGYDPLAMEVSTHESAGTA